MKLENFFEKFDQLVDAPKAIAKMRELVMWSAFSGVFSSEKRSLCMPEEWAAKGAPTLPAIPSSWRWQRGSEVFEVIRGVSYKKNDASDSPAEGFFPVLRANNIGNGINFNSLVYVPRSNIREEKFVRRGDILIAMSSGSKKLVGKAAPILAEFIGAFGAFCGVVRNKSEMPDEVLARYFQSPQYTSWVTAAGRGIGINNLGKSDLDSLPVPTPPLAEQKLIVAKVDELMALCDSLEAQQQEQETQHAVLARAALARFAEAPTPANLNLIFHKSYDIDQADLRKAILTLAVQGMLVPQDPRDEPAEVMLRKIATEKKGLSDSGELKADKKAWVNSSINPPHDIPESWCWVRLQDVFEISRGGSPRPAGDPRFFGGTIPWITVGEITKDSGKYLTGTATGLTEEGSRRSRSINPGDLLLTNSGATLGVPKISKIKGCMNDGVAVLRIFHSFDLNDFGYLYLTQQTPAFRNVNQGMGQPNLNTPIIAGWFFPLPPLAEQRRIVAKVDELMALVDSLEAQLATARTTAADLLDALISEFTARI
ncbi:MAG: restriction endonuclease subunit S [Thermoanaerobaculia bacterium]